MISFTRSETVQKYDQNGSINSSAPPKLESGKRKTKAAAEKEKILSGEREGVSTPNNFGAGTRRQLNSRDISKFDMEYETLVASQPKIAVFWPFEH